MRKLVCVQGLGFVGAAMATAVASARDGSGDFAYDVVGIDLPTESGEARVTALNEGRFPFETSDPKLEQAVREAAGRNLLATTDASHYKHAHVVVVDVHLDIPFRDDEPQLHFDGFVSAIRAAASQMPPTALMIVETTVPPGTCEKIVAPVIAEEFQKRGLDPEGFLLAHSYERVMPGREYFDSIVNFWRVYSGHTPEAAARCEEFLSSVINVEDFPLTRLSSTTASETAKVLENTYRALNISFISEWTRYAEAVGIDLFEVIAAIQKRPTHSNIRFPGLGIGGYCLTKDPTFTPAATKQLFGKDLEFPFSRLAVKASAEMPLHAVRRFTGLMGGDVRGKKILLCGVSYRQDVGDTRYSPSETVYRELERLGAAVDVHDPYVTWWEELGIPVPSGLPASDGYDGVLFALPHDDYRALDLGRWITDKERTLVLDTYMVFSRAQRARFRDSGVRIESIGVGEGL